MTTVGYASTQDFTRRGYAAVPLSRHMPTIVIQAMLVLGLGGWLLLAPPAEGMMMLVPLSPSAARELPALALRDGTRLVAVGTTPGSLIVYGRARESRGPAACARHSDDGEPAGRLQHEVRCMTELDELRRRGIWLIMIAGLGGRRRARRARGRTRPA